MRIAKAFTTFLFILAVMAGCAPSIKSISGEEVGKKIYSNPIIIIPYVNEAAKNHSARLKENLEALFHTDGRKVEVVTFLQKQESLILNDTSEIYSRLDKRVKEDMKDLILVFRTKSMKVYQGGLLAMTYMVAATDAVTHKEIWKAECVNENFYSAADFGKKTAAVVYGKLKSDKVL
jgi:hypothetical protein